MRIDASDFVKDHGPTGAAIQAAIDKLLLDSNPISRSGTVYVPRIPGIERWEIRDTLRLGHIGTIVLEGDGMGNPGEPWSGTHLDAKGLLDRPAIMFGGIGSCISKLNLAFGKLGIHFDGNSRGAPPTSSRRLEVRSVGLRSNELDAIAVLIRGSGPLNGGQPNDQVASESVFEHVFLECTAAGGIGLFLDSKQAVNVRFCGGGLGGGKAGLVVRTGGLTVYGTAFSSPMPGADHVVQYGWGNAFSSLTLRDTYHELWGPGGACFRGMGRNYQPTILDGCRFYVQRGAAHWVDAPLFDLLAHRDCRLEAEPKVQGLNRVHDAIAPFRVKQW
jgi:hypothetical protein